MNRKIFVVLGACALVGATSVTSAQSLQQAPAIASSDVLSQISMFSYREGPKSELFLRSTPIAETAEGKARVEYQDGNAEISAKVEKLPKPESLGPYTVYVLWALTPDGRAVNQGVLAGPEGGRGEIKTQYGASQFALIVTAEPHFAVTVPSSMVALYNVADDVKGKESKIATLTERADYSNVARIAIDDRTNPPEIVQARYAVAIADAAGAERFAPRDYAKANEKLAAAQSALGGNRRERKTAPGLAREAVVAGEDARRAAMLASAAATTETERLAAASEATATANRAASVASEAASRAASAATETASRAASAATETASRAADAATEAATVASRVALDAERQRSATAARNDLLDRLRSALPTHESDRGLISEIGGVQFATGRAEINAPARENLSRFAGIVASYPDLRFNVEGHTDSTGSSVTNDALSLQRAMTVRDYLIGEGVAASSIDVAGLGSSMPIAGNSRAEDRARNRRVEIVLSGGPLAAQ
jgi:outer membrane protein OmpA-like peptidoglycan-associated protein